MKSIYISLPITGQEETYKARLNAAVEYVKAKYPDYERIVNPKEIADDLYIWYRVAFRREPFYKEYLLKDIERICDCDAIFMCDGWSGSKGCHAEYAFAKAIGIDMYFENQYEFEYD